MNLSEKIKVEWCHAVVVCDTREKVHKDKLTVTFASITRLFIRGGLGLCATLDDDDRRCATTSNG